MEASTRPPASCITGNEMPNSFNTAVPATSIASKNIAVLSAIFLASVRNTLVGAGPTIPRKTSEDPIGFTTGSNAPSAKAK
jgi:hypothetical protein